MTRFYVTDAEKYILSFISEGQFYAENRQFIHDHVSPNLIRDLLETYDHEDAISFLDYVIERIDIRHTRAKDRRLKHEPACYHSWLMNVRAQVESHYLPEKAEDRRQGLMGAVKRMIGA